MLRSLQIENYALIHSLNITFDDGFTVITGETGAGKSIVLGALSLILGSRADTSILYDKTRKCFVEGHFDIRNLHLNTFFEENDIDYDDDTILRREVNEKGKSRAFINDTPVNLQTLRALAVQLVDIHSQHHILLLNDDSFRIKIIDEYAKLAPQVFHYQQLLEKYNHTRRNYEELVRKQQEAESERDFVAFITEELENANLYEDELEDNEKQIHLLSNAEEIKNRLYHISQILSESEESVLIHLKSAQKLYDNLKEYSGEYKDYSERIDKIIIELEDIAFDTSKQSDEVEVSPEKLEQLKERHDLIYSLLQKHHLNTVTELCQKRDEGKEKLQHIEDNKQVIEDLEILQKQLYEATMSAAKEISKKRKEASVQLSKVIMGKLHLLGMKDAVLQISFDQRPQFAKSGIDEVKYLFSANKGSSLNEIEKVASGGEISRLMLAIKSVISETSLLPTIIFDEIDTGISGETAGKVAALMHEISLQRQLLVITHLPQVAAKAKLHYYIFKETRDNDTFTNIRTLDENEHEVEIAKMMSGDKVSAAALQAAKELIYFQK